MNRMAAIAANLNQPATGCGDKRSSIFSPLLMPDSERSERARQAAAAALSRCGSVTAWMDRLFTRTATTISTAAGQPLTFILGTGVILIWAITGPLFHFSDTWQLIINTGTTIVTFIMVFLIQ